MPPPMIAMELCLGTALISMFQERELEIGERMRARKVKWRETMILLKREEEEGTVTVTKQGDSI